MKEVPSEIESEDDWFDTVSNTTHASSGALNRRAAA